MNSSLRLGLGLYLSCSIKAVHAQSGIVPDRSLPVNSTVTQANNSTDFFIDGGTVTGTNLFHSFESFSIPQNNTIIFRPDTNVTDVLSRVTGNQVSNIDGRLEVTGSANFFLINPNGIIFGTDASLDVGGSMVATTADRFLFDDGSTFGATAPTDAPPLLSISRPSGLQFGDAPGTIINRSQSVDGLGKVQGLRVKPGKTLALIGGTVEIEGGQIVSPQSSIELGGVGKTSLVSLTFSESQVIPGYEEVTRFSDIKLSQFALVDSSGLTGGRVNLQGKNISLIDGSRLFSNTFGSGTGEDVVITASKNFEIVGVAKGVLSSGALAFGALTEQESSVAVQLFGNGQGGNLFVQAQRVSIRDGATLNTSLFGSGLGGDLNLDVSESIEVVGKAELLGITPELRAFAKSLELDPFFLGEITTASSTAVVNFSTGTSGKLNIISNSLIVRDGGLINANPVSTGPGGNIDISITESLDLVGAANNEAYATSITASPIPDPENPQGQPGNLKIKTSQLRIFDGARIELDTARASGGLASIEAKKSIEISGRSPSGKWRSAISTRSTVEGTGGRIDIKTDHLSLSNYGLILSGGSNTFRLDSPDFFDPKNKPKGGDISILANSISLNNFAEISTAAESDLGGNINLDVRDVLLLRRNSTVSAKSGASGTGGNISIRANLLVAANQENNDIIATAVAGAGGKININTQGLLGFQASGQLTPESDISASSEVGLDGEVTINSPTPELDSKQNELGQTFAPPALAAGCHTITATGSSFVNTGRGGLPASPVSAVSGNGLWQDLEPLPSSSLKSQQIAMSPTSTSSLGQPVVQSRLKEAIAWTLTDDGEVQLLATEDEAPLYLSAASTCSPN